MGFAIGDVIEWASQASGFSKTKRGRVLAIVPVGTVPNWMLMWPDHKCMSGGSLSRKHESYVVEVRPTPESKPRVYWPVVSQLKLKASATPTPTSAVAQ
jgi:hypothetical protein